MGKKMKNGTGISAEDEKFPLPVYKKEDDIYSRDIKESLKEEDDLLDNKNKIPGGDLEVPGSELDDTNEEIGEEDEENNYYSLGGEDHEDLENDQS